MHTLDAKYIIYRKEKAIFLEIESIDLGLNNIYLLKSPFFYIIFSPV